MPDSCGLPEEVRATFAPESDDPASIRRALKNFRYIVSSVNADAERTWAELWEQLRGDPSDSALAEPEPPPAAPEGDRARIFENFWLLKHYLDYIQRLCRETARP